MQIVRSYKVAKDSAVKARTWATNQLKAVLVTTAPALPEGLAGLNRRPLIRACAALSEIAEDNDSIQQATRLTPCVLAQRIGQLPVQIWEVERRLAQLVETHFPQLLAAVGSGPDTAATLLVIMGDNIERMRSGAAFAALCGASPIAYHSGLQRRQARLPLSVRFRS
ncbi:transposase [Streptomyces sp. NPDC003006]